MKIYKTSYGASYEKMLARFQNEKKPPPIAMAAQAVNSGSSVLEFGCSFGNLTRYLTEEKNCKVSICEMNEEAAEKAAHFAERTIIGDCESLQWVDILAGQQFDIYYVY